VEEVEEVEKVKEVDVPEAGNVSVDSSVVIVLKDGLSSASSPTTATSPAKISKISPRISTEPAMVPNTPLAPIINQPGKALNLWPPLTLNVVVAAVEAMGTSPLGRVMVSKLVLGVSKLVLGVSKLVVGVSKLVVVVSKTKRCAVAEVVFIHGIREGISVDVVE
jgi:hypothetical protein